MSRTMTPRQAFLAAINGETPDLTPTLNVSALTTVELQRSTGCSMPEVHHDPDKLVRLLYANHEVLGFDSVTFLISPRRLDSKLRSPVGSKNSSVLLREVRST